MWLQLHIRRLREMMFVSVGCFGLLLGDQVRGAESLSARIDALVASAYSGDGPGAAVLVARGNEVVLRKGYGLANLEETEAVSPDQVFHVASITKQFTAAAILQLVAQGKVGLDDPITKYVPWVDTHGARITIYQLLTHTSGLPNYSDSEVFRSMPRQDLSLGQILGLIKGQSLRFAPGADWEYSNTGYVLLGAVIEKASGLSYERYLEERLFRQAGLAHTFYGNAKRLIPHRIPGYSRDQGGWANAEYLSVTQAFAAGGLVSTVDDLWAWEKALESGRVVRRDLLAMARTPARLAKTGEEVGYGFGWELGYIDGKPAAGHGGTMAGFRSYEVSLPQLNAYIVILCNADRPRVDPQDVATSIARVLAGERTVALPDVALRGLDGVYRLLPTRKLAVVAQEGHLYVQATGRSRLELTAVSDGSFIDTGSGDWYGFHRGSAGVADGVEYRPRVGVDRTAVRVSEPFELPGVAVAETVLDQYVGNYRASFVGDIQVMRMGSALRVQIPGQEPIALVPETASHFRLALRPEEAIDFRAGNGGKVDELVFSDERPVLTASKVE